MADRLRAAARFLRRLIVIASLALGVGLLLLEVAASVADPWPTPAGVDAALWQQATQGVLLAWAVFIAAAVTGVYVAFDVARLIAGLIDRAVDRSGDRRRDQLEHADGPGAVAGG